MQMSIQMRFPLAMFDWWTFGITLQGVKTSVHSETTISLIQQLSAMGNALNLAGKEQQKVEGITIFRKIPKAFMPTIYRIATLQE